MNHTLVTENAEKASDESQNVDEAEDRDSD